MKKEKFKWTPQKAKTTIFVLIIIVTTLAVSFSQFFGPVSQSEPVPSDKFSTERALDHIKNIAKEPHPMDSVENKEVREYIFKYFEKLGIQVKLQRKDVSQIKNTYDTVEENLSGYLENIIATIPGKSQNAVMLTAHYDSTADGPGAADDGYGVSTILETARAIMEQGQLTNTIYFVITDGEEKGLLGASAFVDNKDILDSVKIVINLEARGNEGVPILFETNTGNFKAMQIFKDTVQYPVAYSFAYEMYKHLHNDTDFTVYKDLKKQGYNFANINGIKTYHEITDNIENINKQTLHHFGTYTFPLIERFAFMNSETLNDISECNESAVYFPLFRSQIVVYPESYVIPMVICLLLLTFGVIFTCLRKKILDIKSMLTSTMLLLASLLGNAIIIFICLRILKLALSFKIIEYIYIYDVVNSDFFMAIFMLLTVLVSYIMVSKLAKRYDKMHIAFGFILIWVILSCITSFSIKGISYIFVIPTTIFLATSIPLVFQYQKFQKTFYKYFFVASWLIPSLIILSPIVYLIYVCITIGSAPITAILVSLITISGVIATKCMFD